MMCKSLWGKAEWGGGQKTRKSKSSKRIKYYFPAIRNSYSKDETVHVPYGSFVLTAFSSELVSRITQ